jgi:hypothetical protein
MHVLATKIRCIDNKELCATVPQQTQTIFASENTKSTLILHSRHLWVAQRRFHFPLHPSGCTDRRDIVFESTL